MESHRPLDHPGLEDILAADRRARSKASELVSAVGRP
jgi:hypothetical protein